MAGEAAGETTFKPNFTDKGVELLRERVKEKLREFMGDYTDDTLVEYVIVLLRNGRRKDDVKKELHVFLGDDNDAFINWLWDHLSLCLDLYVHPTASSANEQLEQSNMRKKVSVDKNISEEQFTVDSHGELDGEVIKSSGVRNAVEYKDSAPSVQERTKGHGLRSVIAVSSRVESVPRPKSIISRRSLSPDCRKRSRAEPELITKRASSALDAPRRLLQFAVRDAVGMTQQHSSRTEPDSKRLRSSLSTLLKTERLSDVAQDASKMRSSVFDRLGDGADLERDSIPSSQLRSFVVRDQERYADDAQFDDVQKTFNPTLEIDSKRNDYAMGISRNVKLSMDKVREVSDAHGSFDVLKHPDLTGGGQLSMKRKKSVQLDQKLSQEADAPKVERFLDERSSSSLFRKSRKFVNSSVNANVLKTPKIEQPRDVKSVKAQMPCTEKLNSRVANADNVSLSYKDSAVVNVQVQSQKIKQNPAPDPLDDNDSRTLLVSNVHFAATKDALSRHFNKFGSILKVILIVDPATGRPTGSAYVEFLQKESAEIALSLDGTSFMSRILKVIRKSSTEATSALGKPRIPRGSSSLPTPLVRTQYPKAALSGAFRGRPTVVNGARSLQWKRGSSTAQRSEVTKPTTLVMPATSSRSFTYIRPT